MYQSAMPKMPVCPGRFGYVARNELPAI
uniref:Uncharacterized protein n=1 Tax=Anguilla anguilla TaxID=7936 RepID=A0A0E9RKH8_ANGAN